MAEVRARSNQETREGERIMIYKVEIRGKGVMPYEFITKQEAEDYAVIMTAWTGGQYRIHRVKSQIGIENLAV